MPFDISDESSHQRMTLPVHNISAYCFAPLQDLQALRSKLTRACQIWNLRGTILLATEGINLFVAGSADEVDQLLCLLRSMPGFEGLQPKISESRTQPFSRMLVKIKKEIISFGVPGIDPARNPAPKMTAHELKRWLDEGRPVTLLDTRNDYEVELGTFRNAVSLGIEHFREFPPALAKLSTLEKHHPIITFCTGGIRCEKAGPYLIQQGFQQVFQLEGGILKYFEACGNDHFQGECFVFDKRVGLSADLGESGHGLCYVCQSLLTIEEKADPRTVVGVSCPRCYRSPETLRAQSIEVHHARLKLATTPLPGRLPKDNFRPLSIDARHDGWTLGNFLTDVFPHLPQPYWLERFANGEILDPHLQPVLATQQVHSGERYCTREPLQVEPDVSVDIQILYEDRSLIVINKPAPLPMHPSGRYYRNTLQSILQQVYAPQKPRPAHRLDANTSGVVVFTRTARFARILQPQFEQGKVYKRYLARIVGHPPQDTFACDAPLSATAGRTGSRVIDATTGIASFTEFRVLVRSADGTSLVIATPKTGRTNQIRVHLWHLGWPIMGDATYLAGHTLGNMQTLSVEDSPLCLHAWQLTFQHPQHSAPISFEATAPLWAQGLEQWAQGLE